jgi:hypothetical protein
MRRTSIIVLMLTLSLGACQGDDGTDVVTSDTAEPTVVTGLQAFCNDLDALAGQLQEDITGQEDAVSAVQDTASTAVETLREDSSGLSGDEASAAKDVVDAVAALADWKPNDTASFDDLIGTTGQAADSFRTGNC